MQKEREFEELKREVEEAKEAKKAEARRLLEQVKVCFVVVIVAGTSERQLSCCC